MDIMDEFIDFCKGKAVEYTNLNKNPNKRINKNDVFVVWSCKTLQNAKALLSTTNSDGMYYECTFNGDKNEVYFDAYKKEVNIPYDYKGVKNNEN